MPADQVDPQSTSPVTVTSGLPETVLPAPDAELVEALTAAYELPVDRRREAAVAIASDHPRSPAVWALLGPLGRDPIETYAYYRVGYHRGLDALRGAGWRGSGVVRWAHEENRAFLTCLDGLRSAAGVIGERDEEERCALFLRQLDPAWRAGRTGVPG